jgi:hypothetical protein
MLSARNGLWLTKASPPQVPSLRTDGMIQAIASGEVRLASSYSNVVIQAGIADVLTVTSSNVTVNANLLVNGTIDSVYSSDLHVKDKTVIIGAILDANGCNVGGSSSNVALNDGAGISVGGGDAQSLRWKRPALAADGEGSWTFRGGGLKVVASASNAYGGEITYGFSINAATLALEVYAVLSNASGTSRRCVASFGPPSASNVLTSPPGFLPVSALPW